MKALLMLAILADAATAFDPTAYLKRQVEEKAPAAASTLTDGDVTLNGIRYRRFGTATAAILIPDFTRIDKASLERAQCETPKPTVEAPECEPEDSGCLERAAEREKETTTIVTRAEIKVADHLKIYAAMLLSTIRNKCGANVGFAPKGNMVEVTAGKLAPEIGIEYKDEHRRDPTTYKIFNRGLQKALGFGAEF